MGNRADGSACDGVSSIVGCATAVVFGLVVVALLFPVFAKCGISSPKSYCQSNMKQMGSAFKMYLQDWHDKYPTNRPVVDGKVGPISCYVKLTDVRKLTPGKKPDNLSWVEGLYPYMEMPSEDNNGAWECRAASTAAYPEDSKTAYTTYVMNRNLVERPEDCLRAPDRTMIAREADRHLNAELRPTNYSCGRPDVPPDSPFLTDHDSRLGETKGSLHANGSHVLFADSHVKFFSGDEVPDQSDVTTRQCWDGKDNQWYNYADEPTDKNPYHRAISITP